MQSTDGRQLAVTISQATVIAGPSPYVGESVEVTGTSGSSGRIAASSVKQSGGGTITAPSPAPSAGPTALPTAAPTPAVPLHVQTAEYLWSTTEEATNPSLYAPYLTYAYTKPSLSGVTHAAGIKTIVYTNPLMPHGTEYEYSAIAGPYANVQARDCSGNAVTSYSGGGYLADVMNVAAGSYVSDVVNHYVNAVLSENPGYSNPFDYVFVDNANSFYGVTPMPCNYSAPAWTSAMDTALAAEPYPTILNTLATAMASIPAKISGLSGSNIAGGEYEECYNNRNWLTEQAAQIQTIAALKNQGKRPGPGFWCYLDNTSADAGTVIPLRLFVYASFLLTYDPAYSVFQESFTSSPSTFKVMPETGFVPLVPESVPTDVSRLQTASGAYVQQFAYCYYRGMPLGGCEIAVNPGTATVSVPNPHNYQHSAVLTGSGVLDGGQMTFGGGGVTSLAPNTAAIVLQ